MVNKILKIAFMGTPDFASQALQAILNSEHEVIYVYSQPPRPKGRGQKLQKSSVHILADSHEIPVYTPKSLKGKQAQDEFVAHDVDVAIVAAYGLILPSAVLSAPKYGCLNIHASLLPRWRGASPIQRAIWDGDDKTGVTIMQMDKGLDTGDIIIKGEVDLTPEITAPALHDKLANMGADLVVKTLDKLAKTGGLDAQGQDDSQASYAHLLKKQDGIVNWEQSAVQIDRQIRALNPWPGVWAEIQESSFKILQAEIISNDGKNHGDSGAGALLNKDGDIMCGDGCFLRVKTLQPIGKKPMDFKSSINGGYISL